MQVSNNLRSFLERCEWIIPINGAITREFNFNEDTGEKIDQLDEVDYEEIRGESVLSYKDAPNSTHDFELDNYESVMELLETFDGLDFNRDDASDFIEMLNATWLRTLFEYFYQGDRASIEEMLTHDNEWIRNYGERRRKEEEAMTERLARMR